MIKKRYLVIILLIFCNNLLFAQHAPAWGGGADQQDLSFGFSFSYVNTYLKILKSPNWQSPFLDPQNGNKPVTSSLNSISSAGSAGFAVGFLARYSLTEHLEARITPSLIFASRMISYAYVKPSDDITKTIQATTVDFPLLFKLKSDRISDFRAYVIGGIKYSYALGAGKSDAQASLLDKNVKNVSGYASYEAGIGCDIYFEYFKLSPELKISNSLGNVLIPEKQPFSSPLSKLYLHTLMFTLHFE